MNSEIDKKIEQLLLLLRSTEPSVRYKTLHKLNQILLNEDFRQYKSIIIQNITKYASFDKNEKIRLDARNILYMHGELVDQTTVKKLNTSFRSVLIVLGLLFFMLLIIYLVIPGERKEGNKVESKMPQVVENNKKYSMKINPPGRYSDSMRIEIKNRVVFKGKPLFNNITKFKLNRDILKIYKNGSFIMRQKISEGFGITSDLHPFGYPNPGENLYITYNHLGEIKSLKINNKVIKSGSKNGFSRLSFPDREIKVGESWIGVNNSDFRFNNVVYANNLKLIHLLYSSETPIKIMENKKMSSRVEGEIYLDFSTKLPLITKTTTFFNHNSYTSSVAMNTITSVTETSSKLDKLKLEAFLSDNLKRGILQLDTAGKGPKGVTR